MGFGITFAPLVPAYVLWAALAVAIVLVALLAFARSRGWAVRALALAMMVLALANPSFTREDREPLSSVVAVVVDKSPSQNFGDRLKQTETARALLAERLGRIPGLDVRFVEAGEADGETDGTKLFSALNAALADVPPDRVAGAIMLTDGRVHDVPAEVAALGFNAPVHALITGARNERDRRVVLVTTPRFGIVGQSQTVGLSRRGPGRTADAGRGHDPPRRRGAGAPHRHARQHHQRANPDPARRAEHRRDRSLAARERTDAGEQPRGGVDRRRARQAPRAAGVRRAACRRAHLAQPAEIRRQRRSRPLHDSAPAGEAGRHADQRAVADRVSDPRAVPAEDQGIQPDHLRPLRPPGRAADHLFRQHRPLCAGGRRGAGRRRARTTPARPASGARRSSRSCRRSRAGVPSRCRSTRSSPTPASAIR